IDIFYLLPTQTAIVAGKNGLPRLVDTIKNIGFKKAKRFANFQDRIRRNKSFLRGAAIQIQYLIPVHRQVTGNIPLQWSGQNSTVYCEFDPSVLERSEIAGKRTIPGTQGQAFHVEQIF